VGWAKREAPNRRASARRRISKALYPKIREGFNLPFYQPHARQRGGQGTSYQSHQATVTSPKPPRVYLVASGGSANGCANKQADPKPPRVYLVASGGQNSPRAFASRPSQSHHAFIWWLPGHLGSSSTATIQAPKATTRLFGGFRGARIAPDCWRFSGPKATTRLFGGFRGCPRMRKISRTLKQLSASGWPVNEPCGDRAALAGSAKVYNHYVSLSASRSGDCSSASPLASSTGTNRMPASLHFSEIRLLSLNHCKSE
jgi:hypothetical protein